MLLLVAALLGGALFVWEDSDHSATAMAGYGDLLIKIGLLVGLLFVAIGVILWLVRRSHTAPGDR